MKKMIFENNTTNKKEFEYIPNWIDGTNDLT
jgi:hypothetical protein